MKRPLLLSSALFAAGMLARAPIASAQTQVSCFAAFHDDAGTRAGATSDAVGVTFATAFRASDRCVYSLRAGTGPFHPPGDAAGDTDFATLVHRLWSVTPPAERPAGDRALAVYACSGADCGSTAPNASRRVQSVFLDSCASQMLSAASERVRLRVNTESHLLEITPNPAPSCGANGTVLRVAPMPGGTPSPTCEGDHCGVVRVALNDAHTQALPVDHDWAVYAQRREGQVGMYLGHLHVGNPDTALRHLLRESPPQHDWFQATWEGSRFHVAPSAQLSSHADAWDEWRVATEAQEVWLTDVPATPDDAPSLQGALQLSADGNAMLLPDEVIERSMRARYGAASAGMVPTLADWQRVLDGLQTCVIPRYDAAPPQRGARVPSDARCVRLRDALVPMQLQTAGSTACVHHRLAQVTRSGARATDDLGEQCQPMGTSPAQASATADVPFATVGDTLTLRHVTGPLVVCVDNQCQPIAPDTAVPLAQHGLVEVRAGSASGATSSQGVTLARIAVIDPATDWHPVGMYTASGPRPAQPWSTLEFDADDAFAFVRRSRAPTYQISTSAALAAAVNAPPDPARGPRPDPVTLPSRLVQDVPVLASTDLPMAAPAPSSLVVILSRDADCPNDRPDVVRREARLDPHGLQVDERFHVFLAHYTDEQTPFQCLARATFRVRTDHTLAPIDGARWLQLRLLGDPHVLVYYTGHTGIGLALPIGTAYALLPTPADWFHWGIDASLLVTAGYGFENHDMNRTGGAVSLSLSLGFWRLSRLLDVGVVADFATYSNPSTYPVAGYVGLNLGPVFDLLRGN